ncbi:hypothetical protein ACSHT0_14155 [Tepidicaulis sp. LMO-SS28]|uniref:hypothetical protein n=1 Tax=Tepidicaulis sp. LMO-SS28 TaxID=3447455 RepID=UPI003EE0FAD2
MVTMICGCCGSKNVRRDAFAEWSEEYQCWELAELYDDSHCHDCGEQVAIEEIEIQMGASM